MTVLDQIFLRPGKSSVFDNKVLIQHGLTIEFRFFRPLIEIPVLPINILLIYFKSIFQVKKIKVTLNLLYVTFIFLNQISGLKHRNSIVIDHAKLYTILIEPSIL